MGNLKELQHVWNWLAREDPLWAVLSDPEKKGNRWDPDEFFETGRREIAALMAYIEGLPVRPQRRRALDFGCGAGRLSQALADHFVEVRGVDIASSMIALAARHNRHSDRCQYAVNDAPDLAIFHDGAFEFVYSNITLQHMEPTFSKRYIQEFVRVIAPGGLAIFQLPSHRKETARPRGGASALRRTVVQRTPRSLRSLYRRIRTSARMLAGRSHFDCYEVPRSEVVDVLTSAGGMVLDVVPDASGGPDVEGYRYAVTKG
jgi:ubiquinone/menaquinone biosynthesis C-methylase UbiE